MAGLTVDLKGKINNTRLGETKALWPLFEAVVNSIQSLEDINESDAPKIIEIFAQRLETNAVDFDDNFEVMPFESFTITDTGAGFTSENYKSFKTADSTLKWKKGCKGIGRFLWLKAFNKVGVESTFDDNGTWRKRVFSFDIDGGILPEDEDNLHDTDETSPKTKIILSGFKKNFRDKCNNSLDSLGKKIVEHCLTYFISSSCPEIVVTDNIGGKLCLNTYFTNNIKDSIHQDSFNLDDRQFTLYHVKMPEGSVANELHLCADNREVKAFQLKEYLPNLQNKIGRENDTGFFYAGFLTSTYLDEVVNSSRTDFEFEQKDGQMDINKSLPVKELINASLEYIELYLQDYLGDIETKKQKRVKDYVNKQQPKYRYLLSQRPSTFDAIPPRINDKDLEIALYRELLKWDMEIKQTGEELQKDMSKNLISPDEVNARYNEYCKQVNGLSKTSLADYIVRRKLILDLLENSLELNADGKYASEDSIHSIICPMRYTSDELSFEEMNLWIIDERLAYHNFLASDKTMKAIPVIDSESTKEMDIAIFDEAISFSDRSSSFNSITIIEFKRPNRDDLKTDDKNPIYQVLRYVEDIKSGKKKQANGRPFGNVSNTAFYCYIIADLTSSMKEIAKFSSLRITPDGEGYFGYNTETGAYIEVISFDKLLRDAKERNKVLFDKLFTPSAKEIVINPSSLQDK